MMFGPIYILSLLVSNLAYDNMNGHYQLQYFKGKFKLYPNKSGFTKFGTRSLLDCVQRCHQTDSCVSVIYSTHKLCRLNREFLYFSGDADFTSRRDYTFVEIVQNTSAINCTSLSAYTNMAEASEMLTDHRNGKKSDLATSCKTDNLCVNCYSSNSECRNGSCHCSPCFKQNGYRCDTATCVEYADTFIEYTETFLTCPRTCCSRPVKTIKAITAVECKDRCLKETAVRCRSFNYRPRNGTCQLRTNNRCSCSDIFKPRKGYWHYFHRDCLVYEV